MKRNLLYISIVFMAALFSIPETTNATTLGTADLYWAGYGAYEDVSIYLNGSYRDSTAGVYAFTKWGGTGQGDYWPDGLPAGQVTGFCIELTQPYNLDISTYDVIMPEYAPLADSMGLTRAKYIEELWGRYYDSVWEHGGDDEGAAAFSIAIWEILYEDIPDSTIDWDLTSGNFFVEDYDCSLAHYWLSTLNGSGPKADLRVFSNGTYQDYITAVPEPATIALLGMGTLAGLFRRKKICR